jgi:hypothetical protein
MRGMTVFGAALAALLLCSFAVVAPWAGGPSGEMHDGSIDEAAHLQEELRVGAAELAAVPAESRAVVAKVLGRLGACVASCRSYDGQGAVGREDRQAGGERVRVRRRRERRA